MKITAGPPLPIAPPKLSRNVIVTVTEEEIAAAIRLLLFHTHNLAEGAGAAPLAAAIQLRSHLAGKRVVMILSGGNIDAATLRWVLQEKSL